MFEFQNLDETTRSLMLEEANRDGAKATEYFGKRLTTAGYQAWPDLIRSAISDGTTDSLANALRGVGLLKTVETSHTKDGKPYEKKVPANAAEVLAEGEFNRYYCRALSRRALSEGRRLVVYRGRFSANPRPESEAWIGKEIDPAALLEDLRTNQGREPAQGLPSVNSGLTVKLV